MASRAPKRLRYTFYIFFPASIGRRPMITQLAVGARSSLSGQQLIAIAYLIRNGRLAVRTIGGTEARAPRVHIVLGHGQD